MGDSALFLFNLGIISDGIPYTSIGLAENLVMVVVVVVVCVGLCVGGWGVGGMISLKVRLNRYKIVKHHWTNLEENFQSIKSDSTLSNIILQCVSQCWKAMLDKHVGSV